MRRWITREDYICIVFSLVRHSILTMTASSPSFISHLPLISITTPLFTPLFTPTENSHHRARRKNNQTADLGHRRPRTLPHNHIILLPRRTRNHRRLRRHRQRILQQRQAMAPRNRQICMRKRQQTPRW